jgi:hypothetical protein
MTRQLRRLTLYSATTLALLPGVIHSAEQSPASQAAPPKENALKPEIVTDEQTQTVRIRIRGKDIAVIDANGVHVLGDVNFGGALTDKGADVLSNVGEGNGQ